MPEIIDIVAIHGRTAEGTGVSETWDELPEEWLVDSFGDSRCALNRDGLKAVLSSFREAGFWVIPTALS
jgi:hypothetical protein